MTGTRPLARLRRAWLIAALLTLLTAPLLFIAPSSTAAANPPGEVVDLVNAYRRQAGLAPLHVNPSLTSAAQSYANVLASGGCFGHSCGSDLGSRVWWAGYPSCRIGENIAGGQRSPEAAMATWMNSWAHRNNILNAGYAEIGVGVAYGGPYGVYWVQVFGAR